MVVKTRRNSIYVIFEGYEEGYFLEHLGMNSDVRLNSQFCNGGSSNQIVINGIKHSARDMSVYVFFDEDFEAKQDQRISDETLEGLTRAWKLDKDSLTGIPYKQLQVKNKNMKNPMLIVSHPQSLEGLLLRLLDTPKKDALEGKTTKQLKQIIDSMLGNVQLNSEDIQQIQYYNEKIAKYREEIAKQRQSDPNYHEHSRSLESKIENFERSKNKVTFMRFLCDKLPLPIIITRRAEIPEIDLLLKAFRL
jgi:hypothetical protein